MKSHSPPLSAPPRAREDDSALPPSDTIAPASSQYERAQAEFAKLPNKGSRKRPALTRKLGFIVSGDTATHFLNHNRDDLQQSDDQLSASIDARIAAHPIFGEFDCHPSTIWRRFGNRVSIQTTTSYSLPRLRMAVEWGVRYDELPHNLVASPVDGNTLGADFELRSPSRGRRGKQPVGPRKSRALRVECYNAIAAHRATMDAMSDDAKAAAYARAQGFIPVTFEDAEAGTAHLVTARVPQGYKGYVEFPPDMTLDKLMKAGPGIDPAKFSIPVDTSGRPVVAVNERIDLAQLVWLIGNGHGDGLHRGNVLRRIAEEVTLPP